MGRLDERQHVDADRSVPILQHDRLHLPVIDRGQMHTAPVQKAGAERDSLRRVVVPADDEDLQISSCEIVQEVVKQLNSLGRRNGLVVDVARQDHRIRFLPFDNVQDFFQNIPLIFQHAEFVDPLSQMQVREMNQFQVAELPFLIFQRTISGQRSSSFRAPTMYMAPVNSSRSFST